MSCCSFRDLLGSGDLIRFSQRLSYGAFVGQGFSQALTHLTQVSLESLGCLLMFRRHSIHTGFSRRFLLGCLTGPIHWCLVDPWDCPLDCIGVADVLASTARSTSVAPFSDTNSHSDSCCEAITASSCCEASMSLLNSGMTACGEASGTFHMRLIA